MLRSVSSGGFREFEEAAVEQSIPACFERQVRARPAAIAVLTPDAALTYEALNRSANRVAARLGSLLGREEEPVALLFEQSVEAVIGILAGLKAGKFYLPLDPAEPPARLVAKLDHAGARLVMTSDALVSGVRQWAGSDRMALSIQEAMAEGREDDSRLPISPERLAYLFYTSGSTGQPKGVIDRHRNVLHNVMRYTNNLRIAPGDRLSLVQSPAFSGTVSSLFGALLNGATVCPFPLRERGTGALGPWLEAMEITIYHSVPAIFRGLLADDIRHLPRLRVVRLEGDQVLPSDVELFRRRFGPDCVLAVGLGATETGLSCQHLIRTSDPRETGPVPIGRPPGGVEIQILDAEGRQLDHGQTGEITVRSRFLAAGYWQDPERTARAFRPDPGNPELRSYRTGDLGRRREDGVVEFLGRRDRQPKVRGQRVEVAEVEAVLGRVPGLGQAMAMVREDRPGEARLVAYLVADRGFRPSNRELRETLGRDLPEWMIPTAFVYLDALPLTDHGKVDRRALPAPVPTLPEVRLVHRAPRDALEVAVVEAWQEVLELASVGMTDDFFDLGGDSLRAGRVCARLAQLLRRPVSPASLAAHPTPEALASALRQWGDESQPEWVMPLQQCGGRAPVFFVHDHHGSVLTYLALARRLGADQPSFGVQAALTPESLSRVKSLESLASACVDEVRRVRPSGPYRLAGSCFGGVLAFEMARQFVERGDPVDLLALFQVSPFDFPNLVSPTAVQLDRLHRERGRLASNLAYHRLRLRVLPRGERWNYLRARVSSLGPYLRQYTGARRRRRIPAEASGEPPVAAPLRRLFGEYRARPFSGKVTLCLSRPDARLYSDRAAADWEGMSTTGIDLRWSEVPGSLLLQEPHVEILARHLRAALAGETQATCR